VLLVDRPGAEQPGCTLRAEVRDNRRGTDLWRSADCGFGEVENLLDLAVTDD